jgi:hypothetical protein
MPVSPVDPLTNNVPVAQSNGAPTPFFIRQWQNLIKLVLSVQEALTNAAAAQANADALETPQYVTLAVDATLTNERVLTAGDGISLQDNGAGSTLVVSVTGDAAAIFAPLTTGELVGGTDPEFVVTEAGECIMAEIT